MCFPIKFDPNPSSRLGNVKNITFNHTRWNSFEVHFSCLEFLMLTYLMIDFRCRIYSALNSPRSSEHSEYFHNLFLWLCPSQQQ